MFCWIVPPSALKGASGGPRKPGEFAELSKINDAVFQPLLIAYCAIAIDSLESDEEVRNTNFCFMLTSVVSPPTMKSTTSLGWNWLTTPSIVGENGPTMTVGWFNINLRNAGSTSTESAASST